VKIVTFASDLALVQVEAHRATIARTQWRDSEDAMFWGRLIDSDGLRAAVRMVVAAAFALVLLTVPTGPVSAAVEQWETFHGCVVSVGDDFVVIRVRGAGAGPSGLHRFGLTGATTADTNVTADACIAVVAWKEDGSWYAQSITAEKEDDGTVEVTTRRRGPS
jgi:hypothetical protein